MTMRAMGAFNGMLPEPTGMVIAFMRDPRNMAFLKYTQLIPAPDLQFLYCKLDHNDPNRLPNLDSFAWPYDDYRPTGKDFKPRADWIDSRVQRWDFPYTIGNATQRIWGKAGINAQALNDRLRMTHAMLHRATRVVAALAAASWGSYNTATPQQLLGTAGPAYFDEASGTEKTPAGLANPNFQLIKKTLQVIKRRIHLATNGAVATSDLQWVLSPSDAQLLARTGEMFEALKQSQYARQFSGQDSTMADNWDLPPTYAGFQIVVEDTPRVIVRQKDGDAGTIADLTVPDDKDYILAEGTSYFTSRVGGLDGAPGTQNFSTVQCWHFGGEARVEAFSEPKHDLIEGHVVYEDKVLVPAPTSGFKLTGFRE